MKVEAVLGGNILGMAFFHDSMKAESVVGVVGSSVENLRTPSSVVVGGRAKTREACPSMAMAGSMISVILSGRFSRYFLPFQKCVSVTRLVILFGFQ